MSNFLSPTSLASRHSEALDALRGIAALSVFFFHITGTGEIAQASTLFAKITSMGQFGVDLFYVLSGYFICGTVIRPDNWSPRQYLLHRARRIVPAYYVSILLIVLASAVLGGKSWQMVSHPSLFTNVVTHVLFIHSYSTATHITINGVYWTLGVEAGFYLIVLLCAKWFRKKESCIYVIAVWYVTAFFWKLAVLTYTDPGDTAFRYFLATQLPGALDTFSVGALIALIGHYWPDSLSSVTHRHRAVFVLFVIATLVGALVHGERLLGTFWADAYASMVWRPCLAIALGSMLLLLSSTTSPLAQLIVLRSGLSWVGKVSYSLYLYHAMVIIFFAKVLRHYGWPGGLPAFVVSSLVASLLIAWAGYTLIERRGVVHAKK